MRTPKTPQETFVFLKKLCASFYQEFEKTHERAIRTCILTRGHGPEHDLTVAKWCVILSDNQDTRELAWVAALLHSIDRLMPHYLPHEIVKSLVDRQFTYLPTHYFDSYEKEIISHAILHHAEKNKPEDSDVLVVLKDADRLANLAPEIIMRIGQFAPAVPSFDLQYIDRPHPDSSFGNLKTALDDLYYVLEWAMGEKFWLQPRDQWETYALDNHWFRTPKAWPIAYQYAQFLLRYIEKVKKEVTWLVPVIQRAS